MYKSGRQFKIVFTQVQKFRLMFDVQPVAYLILQEFGNRCGDDGRDMSAEGEVGRLAMAS